MFVVAPLYPPPLDTGDQPTPPFVDTSHSNKIVDPSELVPATGPKLALLPEPASTLAELGCPVTVTRTPVPVVVNEYALEFHVMFSITVKLNVVSR